jgi:hypothetical protein
MMNSSQLRWSIYSILIALSLGQITGRILAVNSVDKLQQEQARIKAELDKRKAAIRTSLAEHGLSGEALETALAAEIDRRKEEFDEVKRKLALQRPFLSSNDRSRWATVRALVEHGTYAIDEIVSQPGWDTIDMVKHRDRQGEPRLYSSKPALFPTLMAAEYWVIHKLTGKTLGEHPYAIGRFMLVTINVLPLLVYFVLLARLAERLGTTDWGRIFVVAAACLATYLSTFAVTINNHLIAAVSATIALYAALRIWFDGEQRLRYFALAGFFAAFTAANELPALTFFGLLGMSLLWKAPRPTLVAGVPAALVVVAAFCACEYAAHGTVRVAYAHRDRGKDWESGNWYNFDFERGGRVIPSYWKNKAGQSKVDQGEDSARMYALQSLVGHHGVFSLTPIWVLTLAGLVGWWRRDAGRWRVLVLWIGLTSAICLAFYLLRPENDRNYGGMSSGFRWMFWTTPLWLVAMLPATDANSRSRFRRGVCLVLLVFSALSAAYPTWNPWSYPWLTTWFIDQGWLKW